MNTYAELYPRRINGRIVWVERHTLGDTPVNTYDQQLQTAQQTLATSANNALTSAQKISGNTSGLTDITTAGKIANDAQRTAAICGSIASVCIEVAGDTAWAVPYGTVVAAVCAVVAAVATVVGLLWGKNPDKAINALAIKYTDANAQLQQQVLQINNQFYQMLQALKQIYVPMVQGGFISSGSASGLASIIQNLQSTVSSMGLSGFGDAAQNQLTSDQVTYKVLQTELANKSAALMDLMTEFNNIINEAIGTYNWHKRGPKIILGGGAAILVLGIIVTLLEDDDDK